MSGKFLRDRIDSINRNSELSILTNSKLYTLKMTNEIQKLSNGQRLGEKQELLGTFKSRNGQPETKLKIVQSIRSKGRIININQTLLFDPSFIPIRNFQRMGLISLERKNSIVNIFQDEHYVKRAS